VLTNKNGNNKSSVTKLWDVFFGDGIIRAAGITPTFKYNKYSLCILNLHYIFDFIQIDNTYSVILN